MSPASKSLLITAGPTREKIDPIRFISNYSTGVFGYEIAKEARRRGMDVTLISGPTCLRRPRGIKFIGVESAFEMKEAVEKEAKRCGCLIMAAAVSDWKVAYQAKSKIKRGKRIRLELTENPDILKTLGTKKGKLFLVGFALETEDLEQNAARKLKDKNLDMIIANRLSGAGGIFGNTRTGVLIIDKFGNKSTFRCKAKRELAKIILDKILNFNI